MHIGKNQLVKSANGSEVIVTDAQFIKSGVKKSVKVI